MGYAYLTRSRHRPHPRVRDRLILNPQPLAAQGDAPDLLGDPDPHQPIRRRHSRPRKKQRGQDGKLPDEHCPSRSRARGIANKARNVKNDNKLP